MAYQYRGTKHDTEEPQPEPRNGGRRRGPFDPNKCGTYAGYKQHQNHDTPSCRPCKDATARYQRELQARRKTGQPIRMFRDDKCGTLAGYSRHKRHDVPLCVPCQKARAEHRRDYYLRAAA